MWSLLPRRTQVLVVAVASVVAVWALEAVWDWWTGSASGPLRWLSLSATLLLALASGLASFVWRPLWRRFPVLERWIFPDLSGTWDGELRSNWKGDTPVKATFWIRQGLFTTSIKMRSGESWSHSTHVVFELDRAAGRLRAWYLYDNVPDSAVRKRSAKHDGAAWVEMDYDRDLYALQGQYFTARGTTGDMVLRRVSRDIVDGF